MEDFVGTLNLYGYFSVFELLDDNTLNQSNPEGIDGKLDALADKLGSFHHASLHKNGQVIFKNNQKLAKVNAWVIPVAEMMPAPDSKRHFQEKGVRLQAPVATVSIDILRPYYYDLIAF